MNDDVAFIGGGMIGLMSAWRFSQQHPEASISLYEKNVCGAGASHACLGALIPYPYSRQTGLPAIQRQSVQRYPDIVQELEHLTGIDCGYMRGGRLHMFNTPGQLENARVDVARSQGLQRILEPAQPSLISDLEPEAVPCAQGALLCEQSAWLDIPRFLEALVQACRQAGIHIYEHTSIDDLQAAHALADQVVITAGSWTNDFLPHEGITPVKGQGLRLKLPSQRFSRIVKQGKVYAIPHKDGTVIVGSTVEPEAGFDETPTPEGRAYILDSIFKFLPVLQDAEILDHWAGLRPKSGGSRRIARRIDTRTLVAAGQYKIGLCLAPVAADMVCEGLNQ